MEEVPVALRGRELPGPDEFTFEEGRSDASDLQFVESVDLRPEQFRIVTRRGERK